MVKINKSKQENLIIFLSSFVILIVFLFSIFLNENSLFSGYQTYQPTTTSSSCAQEALWAKEICRSKVNLLKCSSLCDKNPCLGIEDPKLSAECVCKASNECTECQDGLKCDLAKCDNAGIEAQNLCEEEECKKDCYKKDALCRDQFALCISNKEKVLLSCEKLYQEYISCGFCGDKKKLMDECYASYDKINCDCDSLFLGGLANCKNTQTLQEPRECKPTQKLLCG